MKYPQKNKNIKIPKEIAVFYGGISEERDICLMEGKRLIKVLKENGHKVYGVEIDKNLDFLKKLPNCPKCAMLCLTEDLPIQWFLDQFNIKYNGSGSLTTSLSLDKILVKDLFIATNIPTPEYSTSQHGKLPKLVFSVPLIVKPSRGGSSHGMSFVQSEDDLMNAIKIARKDDDKVLIEKYITGTEVTIAGLDDEVLGIVEIDKNGAPIYDYETKLVGHVSYYCPARISKEVISIIHKYVHIIREKFDLRNLYRIDAIIEKNNVYFLEINTLPFLAPGGEPYEAVKNKGIEYYLFLKMIIYDFMENKDH